jgi:4-hydroxybenzoate polyprenyltransferase
MSAPEAAGDEVCARAAIEPLVASRAGVLGALSWALVASTLHRLRGGECALLAVNVSLIALHEASAARAVALAVVSLLTIGLMYAFNDLYDAPADWRNPKKDRTVIATYVDHRRIAAVTIVGLKAITLALALAALGPGAAAAVAAVMLVNVVYSARLKGVPLVDVAWCGLWGGLYAAIVTASPMILVVVALMTAVCHLFQTLGDRGPDAANGIVTTAVRSPVLAWNVLVALSVMLFVVLRAPVGPAAAATAFTPLAFLALARTPRAGWLLTKAYFGVLWLYVLGVGGAAG